MKKEHRIAKIIGLSVCAAVIIAAAGLYLAMMLYRDPKEPNKNNWSERTEISADKSDIIGSVFRSAKGYAENARLCSAIYTIYPNGEMEKQTYSFWVPADEKLPDGDLDIFVDAQAGKITYVSMAYDHFSGEPEKALDEAEAKSLMEKALAFFFDGEWEEMAQVRLTCHANGKIEVWAQDDAGHSLWRREFKYSDGKYAEITEE